MIYLNWDPVFTESTMISNEYGKWWRGPAAQPTLVVSASAQAKRAKKNREGNKREGKTRREQDMYTEVQRPVLSFPGVNSQPLACKWENWLQVLARVFD